MASLPVIANVFRAAFNWIDGSGQNAVNVMHFKADSASVPNDLFTVLDAHLTNGCWNLTSSICVVDTVDITPLDGSSASQLFSTDRDTHWQGGVGGQYIPAAAGVVKITTAKRGRSYRGRIFLPFVAEAAQQNGTTTGTLAADCTGAWSTFETNMLASDWATGVASYKLGTWEKSTAITCESVLGTQRRRQSRLR